MISGSTEKAFKQIDILQQINVEFVACAFYYKCFHLFIDLFVFPNTFFFHISLKILATSVRSFQTAKNVNMFQISFSLSVIHPHAQWACRSASWSK